MKKPETQQRTCPHCGAVLRAFRMPVEAGFDNPIHEACFNNDCCYYREGWEWMRQQYNQRASYRYRIDPATQVASPLAVWSEDAILDRIVEEPRREAEQKKRPRRTAKRRASGSTKKNPKPKRRTR